MPQLFLPTSTFGTNGNQFTSTTAKAYADMWQDVDEQPPNDATDYLYGPINLAIWNGDLSTTPKSGFNLLPASARITPPILPFSHNDSLGSFSTFSIFVRAAVRNGNGAISGNNCNTRIETFASGTAFIYNSSVTFTPTWTDVSARFKNAALRHFSGVSPYASMSVSFSQLASGGNNNNSRTGIAVSAVWAELPDPNRSYNVS